MKHIFFLSLFLITTSCARKVEVRAPEFVKDQRFAYVKDGDRVYIVTSKPKDLDEAMKKLRPGPSTVDKLDLWIVTPLTRH